MRALSRPSLLWPLWALLCACAAPGGAADLGAPDGARAPLDGAAADGAAAKVVVHSACPSRAGVCSASCWCVDDPLPPPYDLHGAWGTGPADVWLVGDNGTVLHWDGERLIAPVSPTRQPLLAVMGTGPRDVWAVGAQGTALHFDGAGWTQVDVGTTANLGAVWASAPDDVWVGQPDGPLLLRWDGRRWSRDTSSGAAWTYLFGTGPADVFAVGNAAGKSLLQRWDGRRWSPMALGATTTGDQKIGPLWGTSPSSVWSGCYDGILRYDGLSWSRQQAPIGEPAALWGSGPDDLWVGTSWRFYHFDGKVTWREVTDFPFSPASAVWGASAREVWAAGPRGNLARLRGTSWAPYGHALLPRSATAPSWGRCFARAPDDVWVGMRASLYGDGFWAHHDGASWERVSSSSGITLRAFHAPPGGDLWAVGTRGTIVRRVDDAWVRAQVDGAVTDNFNAVWGSGPSDVFAAGDSGLLQHFDGAAWKKMDLGSKMNVYGLWGSGPKDVYAVGGPPSYGGGSPPYDLVRHYDGSGWRPVATGLEPYGAHLYAVWGSGAQDLWVGGELGILLRYDGTRWTEHSPPSALDITDLWGRATDDIWAVQGQRALRYDGRRWTPVDTGHALALAGVCGVGERRWLVGAAILSWGGP